MTKFDTLIGTNKAPIDQCQILPILWSFFSVINFIHHFWIDSKEKQYQRKTIWKCITFALHSAFPTQFPAPTQWTWTSASFEALSLYKSKKSSAHVRLHTLESICDGLDCSLPIQWSALWKNLCTESFLSSFPIPKSQNCRRQNNIRTFTPWEFMVPSNEACQLWCCLFSDCALECWSCSDQNHITLRSSSHQWVHLNSWDHSEAHFFHASRTFPEPYPS